MLEVRRSITALIAATAIVACSGGDDEGTTEPTPAIDITASAATATVTQGGTASVTVTLTRSGGFTGDVTLAVTGLSANLTAPNVTIPSGSTTGVVTYTAGATAATGTANTTITATGTGVTAKTAAVAVTVNAAPAPSFTMAVTPATLPVTQGANGTVTVNLTRTNGFTGTVNLAATGLPNGVTAAFNPAAVTTNTSTLTLTASATATTGPATVTVTGTSGTITQTATIALTVNAPAAAGFTLAASAATVTAGGTGTSNITITRTGGFADAVTLAVKETLPTGVTAAFAPNNTTTNASVLTLTAAANATPGTTTITVAGTAAGQTEKTATFQLTVAAAASYTVAITEPNLTIAAGATTTANITITRTGGFADAVNLTVENLPAGVTGAFNPASTTGNASVLTLTAAANAAAVGQSILVRGKSGTQDKSASVLLTVTAAAGAYTLALAPSTMTLQQGTSGNTTVNITRTGGFTGAVNFTATGLPNGVTAAFNPASATTNSSTLTLTASGTATTGPATVTVTGTSGAITQTATLALTVSAAVGGSGNTTWEFCTASQTPLWMAIQDGANGTWTRVTPTGTKFQFNITQAKGGVAFVLGTTSANVQAYRALVAKQLSAQLQQTLLARTIRYGGRMSASIASSMVDGFDLTIYYGSQPELNSFGTNRCAAGSGKTVTGTITGLGANQSANISLGTAFKTVTAPATTYTLTNVPDGDLDLVATRVTTTGLLQSAADKMIILRNRNQPNNSVLDLSFTGTDAFDPAQGNITIGNLGGDQGYASSFFFTANRNSATGATLFNVPTFGTGPFKYYGVPTARQFAGDLHQAQAFAFGQTLDQARFAGIYFKDPVDKTVTLGDPLSPVTVSAAATTPYVRFRATGTVQSAYNKFLIMLFTQATTSVARTVNIFASESYLSGLSSFDFAVPDFTGVAGWDNNWGPKAATSTSWVVSAAGYTGVGYQSINPLEGSTFQGATRLGSITP